MQAYLSSSVASCNNGNRVDQEIWNLVGNDPAVIMFGTLYYDVQYHLGSEEDVSSFCSLLIKFENALYDKLAAKHKKPSEEYKSECEDMS